MNTQQQTIKACQFWNEESPYQDLYDTLHKQIPDDGKTSNDQLEMLRLYSIIYYQLYNNGDIQECYYQDLVNLIKLTKKHGIKNNALEQIKELTDTMNGAIAQGVDEPPHWVKEEDADEWYADAVKDYDRELEDLSDDLKCFTDEDHTDAFALELVGVDILLMEN